MKQEFSNYSIEIRDNYEKNKDNLKMKVAAKYINLNEGVRNFAHKVM